MHLAYVLQYNDDVPEVADVEHGKLQVDVAIVTDTLSQGLTTHITVRVLLARTLEQGEGGREGGRKEGRGGGGREEVGWEEGKEGGREEGREGGRREEGGREGGREEGQAAETKGSTVWREKEDASRKTHQ